MKKFLLTVWLLLAATPAWATNWYVHRTNGQIVWAGQYGQLAYATEILDDQTSAELQAFLSPGPQAQLAARLFAGLAVISTSTSALSATYALDATTLDQIGSVARDAAAGLGLPGGLSTFTYPDLSSAPHDFTATAIQSLYKAMRDYVFALNSVTAQLQLGIPAGWPPAMATIP